MSKQKKITIKVKKKPVNQPAPAVIGNGKKKQKAPTNHGSALHA